MKRLVALVAVASAVVAIGAIFAGVPSNQAKTLVLRVSSVDSEQRVRFEGAVVAMDTSAPYRSLKGATPYEIRVTTTGLHALLHSRSEQELLKVEVFEVGAQGEQRVSWIAGSAIVVEQDYQGKRSMVKSVGSPEGVN